MRKFIPAIVLLAAMLAIAPVETRPAFAQTPPAPTPVVVEPTVTIKVEPASVQVRDLISVVIESNGTATEIEFPAGLGPKFELKPANASTLSYMFQPKEAGKFTIYAVTVKDGKLSKITAATVEVLAPAPAPTPPAPTPTPVPPAPTPTPTPTPEDALAARLKAEITASVPRWPNSKAVEFAGIIEECIPHVRISASAADFNSTAKFKIVSWSESNPIPKAVWDLVSSEMSKMPANGKTGVLTEVEKTTTEGILKEISSALKKAAS